MKNYLIAGMFLALTVLACLFFPPALMEWKDGKQTGTVELETVREVTLTEHVSMTLCQKLKLLSSGAGSSLSMKNGKNYTRDTIGDKLSEEVHALSELGIFPDVDLEDILVGGAEVAFYMDVEDSEKSAMIWSVDAAVDRNKFYFMLDDETGKILGFRQNRVEDTGTMYEDQAAEMSVGNKILEAGSLAMGREEITELAGKWAEYLGCTVREVIDDPFGMGRESREREVVEYEIQTLTGKGYSFLEAMQMVGMGYGYDFAENGYSWSVYAELGDEGGEVYFCLCSSDDMLFVFCEE